MSLIVFANLGNRDVVIAGKENDRPPPARQQGEQIRQQLDSGELTAGQLTFPILQPTLEYILRESNGQIDQLILLATDQIKNEAEPWHWNSDTLHYAWLAQAHLAPHFGLANRTQIKLIGQDPHQVNPSLYDEAFKLYEQLLPVYAGPEVSDCYLIISGGIPACNTALLIQGIRYFGSRARLIYLAKDNAIPWESPIGRQISNIMRENSAIQFLDRFDFTAAARLLAQQRPLNNIALALCHYAGARLWFDFAAARSYLGQALADSHGPLRQQLQRIHHGLHSLLDESRPQRDKALLAEIYYNALVAWENERFLDFLARVVRFQAALIEHLLPLWQEEEILSGFTVQDIHQEKGTRSHFFKELQRAAHSQLAGGPDSLASPPLTALSQYLEAHFNLEEIAQLCFRLQINNENIPGLTLAAKVRELLGYTVRQGRLDDLIAAVQIMRPHQPLPPLPTGGKLASLAAILQRLEKLRPLHQQSLIAHGYGGTSRSALLAAYNGQLEPAPHSPDLDMTEVGSLLDLPAVNPFVEIRALIQQQLR